MNFNNNFFLVRQLKEGNEKAYNFLMESYYPNLCAYAETLIRNRSGAEDIVQNVFVTVWIKREQLNAKFSIKSYLYKSVYNEFIDYYRKNKPIVYLEKKYLEALDLVIEKDYEDLEALIKIVDLEINNLPTKCKKIFLLNKKEGLTHIEISEYLKISTKTVEGHMTRAFKILSKKIKKQSKAFFYFILN
ncbi:RNA polymerase sigma factor [Polaribacter cellanae]|uniref:RNA polymerase sigma-70 factor n=1 Tax=Polaribacter cellanae TaxID=2818493 RepID=A0A975CP78_9FLAO|nr:RNA polymerase sigma-70 factor [Polaribacter cellanae]QTE22825.1 RNA polymerase sigma-70 factor [Polaribacter cellanae]